MNPRIATVGIAVGLALLVIVVFWPVRSHDFIAYDDDILITANPRVHAGLNADGIAWAFTSFHGSNWYPLTRLAWMLDSELHGVEAGAFHTTDLGLHALTTLLLFAALVRMTGAPGKSAFVSAVFAVHPLHVESVAWASARKDTLSGLFFVLALWIHASPRASRPAGRIGTSLAMGLGLMAKPMLVTLPFVLLLLDVWPLGRFQTEGQAERGKRAAWRKAVIEKWPLFGLAIGMSVVTILAQRAGGALTDLAVLPVSERVANALLALLDYTRDAFWPARLAIFYPHPEAGIPALQLAGALVFVVGCSIGSVRLFRRAPAVTIGWLWFIGMLLPVIGLVQVGSQARADRYTYLPLIGLAIAVAWGVSGLVSLWLREGRARTALLATAGAIVIGALAFTTSVQLRYWRDTESVMRHALRVTESNAIAHAYLGVALLARGDAASAASEWRESARIEPRDHVVANNLAWLLATSPDPKVRDGANAVVHAERAARLMRDDPSALDTLAAAYAAAGRFDEAVTTAERAASKAKTAGTLDLARQIHRRAEQYQRQRRWIER